MCGTRPPGTGLETRYGFLRWRTGRRGGHIEAFEQPTASSAKSAPGNRAFPPE
ncbi:MAG TPA: hypothetical protein VGH53_14465 [Streptosporangiaceae bacterium]